jgi:membrane protein required for colicin V production
MIWVDYVIIGVVALSAVISLLRGFVREALSLVTWIAAFWIAWLFFRELAVQLEPWIEVPSVRLGAAFFILLLASLVLGGLVGYLAGKLVDKTGLSGTDRLIGALFGTARGMVLVAIMVLLAGLTSLPKDPWWQESLLIPQFQDLAVWLQSLLPPDLAEKFNYA